jgi:hypothetical protein
MRHRILVSSGSAKKRWLSVFEPPHQRRVDAVARHVEEAVCAAGGADLRRDGVAPRRARHERRHVDEGEG